MNEGGGSCRARSRRCSPCSTCWARSDCSAGRPRLAGSDTDRRCAHSDSHRVMDRWRGRYPGGCKHTLEQGKGTRNEEFLLNNTQTSALTFTLEVFWILFIAVVCNRRATPPSLLTSAVVQCGVAIVTQFAALTGRTFAVVQAEQTLAAPGVARVWVQHVDVVVTLTGLTLSARLSGVSIVTR